MLVGLPHKRRTHFFLKYAWRTLLYVCLHTTPSKKDWKEITQINCIISGTSCAQIEFESYVSSCLLFNFFFVVIVTTKPQVYNPCLDERIAKWKNAKNLDCYIKHLSTAIDIHLPLLKHLRFHFYVNLKWIFFFISFFNPYKESWSL